MAQMFSLDVSQSNLLIQAGFILKFVELGEKN